MNNTDIIRTKILASFVIFTLSIPISHASNGGNKSIESFSKAKKLLERSVYFDHQVTLYCDAEFDDQKRISPPDGFKTDKYVKRSKKLEWEHASAAESWGRTFIEWREGAPECVKSTGTAYKGRACANKASQEYRYMASDLHNLFPSVGAVNGLRKNYNFAMLPGAESDFGSCLMKIDNKKAEPPESSRGRVARSHLYMSLTYPRYKLSSQQRQLMEAWDSMYPVSNWECLRNERIQSIQGNANPILESRCRGR
ncbi:endonuclease [Vibrio splendidus]